MLPERFAYSLKKVSVFYFITGLKLTVCIVSGINFAIHKSKGAYIAILDEDDIWSDPGKLEKQVHMLQQNAGLCLISSWALGIDKEGIEISRIKISNDIDFLRKTCLFSNPVIHSSVVYRKQTALDVGLYDDCKKKVFRLRGILIVI